MYANEYQQAAYVHNKNRVIAYFDKIITLKQYLKYSDAVPITYIHNNVQVFTVYILQQCAIIPVDVLCKMNQQDRADKRMLQ